MKYFKTKLTVISTLFLSILLFNSCEKEAIENNLQPDLSNIENKIGEYHNKALDLFYESNKLKSSEISHKNVRNEIINLLVDYDDELFNETQLKKDALQSEKILSNLKISFSLKSTKTTTGNFLELINYLNQNNEISTNLSNQLKGINNATIEDVLNSSEILSLVNNLNIYNWNEKDAKYVNAFTQVYNSSYKYWSNQNKSKSVKNAEVDGNGVILADAAGALYGLILSPIWSIIEGALFSIIANNQ